MIVLTEVQKENWSFAHGIAQYAWEPDYLRKAIVILKALGGLLGPGVVDCFLGNLIPWCIVSSTIFVAWVGE
jgi:hypothetical protein